MLLESGADADRPSHQRHVLPLKKAVLQNDLSVSRLLLDHGASACHCPACSAALGRRGHTGPALVCVRDGGETDLLHLALFTDVQMCRLLVAGGTCVSPAAENIIAGDASAGAALSEVLYNSGRYRCLRRMSSSSSGELRRTELDDGGGGTLDDSATSTENRGSRTAASNNPESLRHIVRVAIRRLLEPKVFWATRLLPLPDIIKSYLTLDWS